MIISDVFLSDNDIVAWHLRSKSPALLIVCVEIGRISCLFMRLFWNGQRWCCKCELCVRWRLNQSWLCFARSSSAWGLRIGRFRWRFSNVIRWWKSCIWCIEKTDIQNLNCKIVSRHRAISWNGVNYVNILNWLGYPLQRVTKCIANILNTRIVSLAWHQWLKYIRYLIDCNGRRAEQTADEIRDSVFGSQTVRVVMLNEILRFQMIEKQTYVFFVINAFQIADEECICKKISWNLCESIRKMHE